MFENQLQGFVQFLWTWQLPSARGEAAVKDVSWLWGWIWNMVWTSEPWSVHPWPTFYALAGSGIRIWRATFHANLRSCLRLFVSFVAEVAILRVVSLAVTRRKCSCCGMKFVCLCLFCVGEGYWEDERLRGSRCRGSRLNTMSSWASPERVERLIFSLLLWIDGQSPGCECYFLLSSSQNRIQLARGCYRLKGRWTVKRQEDMKHTLIIVMGENHHAIRTGIFPIWIKW